MDEFEKLYTVEDIAKMTSLTSRTIRNYLKDGSLQGRKIGGQWRFTMDDIRKLFDSGNFSKVVSDSTRQALLDFIDGVNTDIQGETQICTIIDRYVDSVTEAGALSEKLIAVINNPEYHFSQAKYAYDYVEKEGKARFILYGDPAYIIKVLQLL